MNIVWLVLWLLSSSWLFLSAVFVPPAPLWGAGAIAIAIGLGVWWAAKRGKGGKREKREKPSSCIFCIFRFTDSLTDSLTGSLTDSLILCGLIFLAQAAVMPIVYFFAARYHQVSLLQPLVYSLLKAVVLRISLSDGSLFIRTVDKVFKVSITLERLGFFPFLLYLAGGFMLLFATGQRWSRMVRFFLILFGYCAFRFLLLLVISVETNNQAVFWSSLITSLSFLPLPFLLAEFLPHPGELVYPAFSKNSYRFGGLLFIGSLLLVLALVFCDPGVKKPGRILIDEKHSDWEWTDEKFDTHLFGRKTDYNFYCLSDYLTYFYPRVEKNYQPLTRKSLATTDILILKTPTQEYSDQEVSAIQDFVARGGGLFLIGDHTNVFGMSTYLNKVASRFGLSFRYDVTYDLPTYRLSLYRKPGIFPHPVVRHIPLFLFGSSCTLSIPLDAVSVMTGYGLRNHSLDYSQKNFFPMAEEDPDYEFGLFVQAAAVNYQQGRVLAYTDSTCFSNFFIFIPGKPELLLGSMEWLNRKNRYAMLNAILFLAGIGCLLSLSMAWRPGRAEFLGAVLTFGLAAVVVGIAASRLLNRKNYAYPKPEKDFFQVALESEHSSFFLPVRRLAEDEDKSFLTFYVWTQRLGFVPCLKPSLEEALEQGKAQGKAVVLIDPVKPFSPGELSEIKDYLQRGGTALLMDSPQNQQSAANRMQPANGVQSTADRMRSAANQMLKEFDMAIDYRKSVEGEIRDQRCVPIGEFDQPGCQIKGGDALLTDRKGNALLSIKRQGSGLIAVFGASHLFRDESLGSTSLVPNKYQHWLSQIEFWIFESLAKKEFRPFSLYSQAEGEGE